MDTITQTGKLRLREQEMEHHLLEMVGLGGGVCLFFLIPMTNRYRSCVSLRAHCNAAIIYLVRVKTRLCIRCSGKYCAEKHVWRSLRFQHTICTSTLLSRSRGVFSPTFCSTERGKLSFYFCITTSGVRVLHNAPYEHRDSFDWSSPFSLKQHRHKLTNSIKLKLMKIKYIIYLLLIHNTWSMIYIYSSADTVTEYRLYLLYC